MDEIAVQALNNMVTVLETFVPPTLPNIQYSLIIIPSKVKPTGLGGYVGMHVLPGASLFGRHIEAKSEVTIASSNGVDNLQSAVSSLTKRFLSQDPTTLRSNGIFSINLDRLTEITHSGSGNNAIDSRTAIFNLQFEFIPEPSIIESTIDQLDLNTELTLGVGKAKFFELDFADLAGTGENPLDYFDFVDDPGIVSSSPTGNWIYNNALDRIEQTNNVRGGALIVSPKKAGAQALIKQNSSAALFATNFILTAELESGGADGIGFVFRWIDVNNFYYFLMSNRHNFHLLGKKFQGDYAFLAEGGLNETVGFKVDERMEVKLLVENAEFKVYRNNRFIVSGSDHALSLSGRMGFFTHNNIGGRFYNVRLIDFSV